MAIFHFSIKIGSRGKGQSAIAAAAYRSGTKLMNEELLQASDYTRKGGIIHSEIALCAYAPTEYTDRETLWNAVHKIEKQKNAQLWREFEAALPAELGHDEHIQIVRNFVKRLTKQGMCVDWSIHDTGKGNPHVHMMCTMRSILPDGTWAAKSRKIYELDAEGNKIFQKIDKLGHKQYKTHKESFNNWDSKDRIKEWRIAWEQVVNAFLPEALHIDHRSYAEQGIDKIPTIHEGYGARGRERSGKLSDRCEYNRQTRLQNQLLSEIKELESQMFTVVNTVNDCKQRLEEEKSVSESATPEVLLSENPTELCNTSCNTPCYNTCDTENEEDKAKSHEIWHGVVQAREKFCRVYQLYKESEVLKKLKDKMGDVGKIQEVIQNYESDLQRIAELEQEIQGYSIWHPKKKKAAQLKLIKIQNKLPDEKLIKQYQKVVSTHQAISQRLSELWAYKKSSAESALHTFVDVYKKIREAGLVEQAEKALLEFAVPVFMSELVPEPDSKAIWAKQEEHIQNVIHGDTPAAPDQSEKSPAHQAYFTREQLHQLDRRLKEEQQKKAEIQKKSIKRKSR